MSPVPPTIEEEIREDIRERRAERGTLYKAISTLTTAIQTHERKDDERHIEILDRLAGHGARLSDHAAKITRLEDRADDTGQFVSLERRNKISDARFLKRSFREIVFIALKIGGSAAGGAGVYHIVRSMIGR